MAARKLTPQELENIRELAGQLDLWLRGEFGDGPKAAQGYTTSAGRLIIRSARVPSLDLIG
jgi:hypothetical protein